MTACVNKHSKRVALAISASLVGALSLGAAAPAAFAAEGAQALASSPSDVWEGIEFSWSVEADKFGEYTVQAGDQFMLTSATDAFGSPVSMSDLTVVYFQDANDDDKIDSNEKVWNVTPATAGDYTAAVVDGRVDTTGWNNGTNAGSYWSGVFSSMKIQTVDFKVIAKSLEGAFAYQGDNVADTSFKFTGNTIDVNFADADGKKLVENEDYTISGLGTVQGSGDYAATLTGIGKYSGAVTVKFTVDKIDLENDVITVDTVENGTRAYVNGTLDQSKGSVYVNGEKLAPGVVIASVKTGFAPDGTAINSNYGGVSCCTLTLNIEAASSWASNFVNSTSKISATAVVVDEILPGDFFYDGDAVTDGQTITVETDKGEAFDPELIAAYANGKEAPFSWTAYKDGEAVSEFAEPGTYTVSVEFDVPSDLSYAGGVSFTVNVVSKHYKSQPKVFASIDGKDAAGAKVEYDGKAVEPVVVAKDGSAVIDPADYAVTYKDADGNAVESIVEPGKYTATVDFGNAQWWNMGAYVDVDDVEFSFEVTKATIRSAKADRDVYAYVEDQAVEPTFTAYIKADLKGLSVAIDPAKTGVTYHTAVVDKDGNLISAGADDLKASDLTEEGWYVADVTVAADDAHFTGTVTSKPFQISTYAAFGDVDAGSWYAQGVYNAAKLGYMNGVKGTDLFMPLADISRAELAKVFSNMAGRPDREIYTPTQFGDVDAWAWYAEPIAWASEAGVVTGYQDGSGNFGPNDKATREQVALMLYRYAQAQGQDVSVEDADAALAAYSDGSEVSGWAKEAMAWAVENGVFGVDTDELMPQDNIQRAQVALIAVRYQPERLPEA